MQDAIFVGDSFARLSAALQPRQARRELTAVDADAVHGEVSPVTQGSSRRDGIAPYDTPAWFRTDDVGLTLPIRTDRNLEQENFGKTGFSLSPRTVDTQIQGPNGVTIRFTDQQTPEFAATFAAPRGSLNGEFSAELGCSSAGGPLGLFVLMGPVGPTYSARETAAVGNASPGHNFTAAIGQRTTVGVGCHQSFVFPNLIHPLEDSSHD